MKLTKQFRFEAAHILPKHPGKCHRLHGHSWVLEVSTEGEINPLTGFVTDYADISYTMEPIIKNLDHRCLGDWSDPVFVQLSERLTGHMATGMPKNFYPSSENLLVVIGRQILYEKPSWSWSELTLHETCTSTATLSRKEFDEKFNQI